jgi:hypothetical protein
VGFVNSISGFVDSMEVCRFYEWVCRFNGLAGSMRGLVDSMGLVDSVSGF